MKVNKTISTLKPTDVCWLKGSRYTVLDVEDTKKQIAGNQGALVYNWRSGKVEWLHTFRIVQIEVEPVEYQTVKQNTRFTCSDTDYIKCNHGKCVRLTDAYICYFSPNTKVYPHAV